MIHNYFPVKFRSAIKKALETCKDVEEIRLRIGKNIVFCTACENKYIDINGNVTINKKTALKIDKEDMNEVVGLITQNSIYAIKNEIKNGFITLKNGFRVGVCGRCVFHNDEMQYIKNISGLNIRFARQLKGVADGVFKKVYTEPKNILIISPPGKGKTTLLREFIRLASNNGENISVVDERCELAPISDGEMLFDLGENTDVLSDVPKSIGIKMMLRSMNPEIIATDEIATTDDFESLTEAVHSGVKIFATFHGDSKYDYLSRVSHKNQIKFDNYIYIRKDISGKRIISYE